MSKSESYIREDEAGVMRVGATRVMLDSVVAAFHQGHSPETIQQQYPSLSLQEVYGTIAEYLARREEMDAYLRRQEAVWAEWRERFDERANPVVQRLRSQMTSPTADAR
ncbi:MAG: DUF433 domain-containing protein [Planctomycetaceae bacterium]